MKTLKLKKETVATLTREQFGSIRGGGDATTSVVDVDRKTFGTVCLCASDNMYCPELTYFCPSQPETVGCPSDACPSCGCATYDGCGLISDGLVCNKAGEAVAG